MSAFHQTELPKLAWLSLYEPESRSLSLYHGSSVECRETWAVEGVWDGGFNSGNFHKTRNFFGSGVRVDGDSIFFVPSKALVDRLVYCYYRERLLVSNSMLVLLAYTGARLDLHHDYTKESFTILQGINNYEKDISVDHPEIDRFYQVFYHNFIVNCNGEISFVEDFVPADINSYSEYYTLLQNTLREIQINYESDDRAFPLTPLSTISSGYDSTAVTALVSKFGVRACFTSKKSNSILPEFIHPKATNDDGTPIARQLGLDVEYLDQNEVLDDEIYFLAASCAGPEIIFRRMAQYISAKCQPALVFTGYHGDVIWDMKMKPEESGKDVVRGDTSGFNLSEIRLKSGFINAAIPFMFANSIQNIVTISNSEEMNKWRMNNDYDRPVARRIVEERGVPRFSFGFRKKGVTKYYNYPLDKDLRRKFFAFLKENYNTSKYTVYFYSFMTKYPVLITMGLFYVLGLGKIIDKNRRPGLHFSRLMYVWAVNLLADKISQELQWPSPHEKKYGGQGD